MKSRELRVVRDCPQPESPIKPVVQYGFVGGHKAERIVASPLPHEANIIARVQSMRTRNGARAEPLSYEDSIAYLRDAERKHRVTVPQPLCQPAPQQRTYSPPVAAARAGSIPRIPQPAHDDEAGWADYMRRAMAGEIEAF